MAQFITRVELHGSPPIAVYDRLHLMMEAAGFRRTIQGGDGLWYKMPSAMYVLFSDLTTVTVRDLAYRVASYAAPGPWVFTVQSDDTAWITELAPVTNHLAALTHALKAKNPLTFPMSSSVLSLLGAVMTR